MGPPEMGWIKANADGSVSKHREKGGAGVVLRDHTGAFRAASCHFLGHVADPDKVELLACKKAIELASKMGVSRLHLESDSAGVVSMLNMQDMNLPARGPTVERIKAMLRLFVSFRVSWVRCCANAAAD